jgi:hypothetical protein
MNDVQMLTVDLLNVIWKHRAKSSNTPYTLIKLRHLVKLAREIHHKIYILDVSTLSNNECAKLVDIIEPELIEINEINNQQYNNL